MSFERPCRHSWNNLFTVLECLLISLFIQQKNIEDRSGKQEVVARTSSDEQRTSRNAFYKVFASQKFGQSLFAQNSLKMGFIQKKVLAQMSHKERWKWFPLLHLLLLFPFLFLFLFLFLFFFFIFIFLSFVARRSTLAHLLKYKTSKIDYGK